MSLAVARQPDDAPRVPAPYLPLAEVVALLGGTPRWAQRLCDERWGPDGLAKKFNGVWGVHPRADQRLKTDRDNAKRDREQIAEMEAAGVKPRHLDRARVQRDLIADLADFDCDAPNQRKLREFFLAGLEASGRLAGDRIRKPSLTTFYRWEKAYRQGGIQALVRKSASPAAPAANGAAALEYIFNLVHCGNAIPLQAAITLARGEARKHPEDPAWRIGSYTSVRLAINQRSPAILRVLSGKGRRQTLADCIPKGRRNFESIPAGAEWVGDERTLDVWCRVLTARGWKPVRPVITAWADMRSRVVVGWMLEPYANTNTILGSLKKGIARWGKPAILRVDRGQDYKKATASPSSPQWRGRRYDGQRLDSVLDELGIEVRPVLPYTPWSKPIESFFKTMKNDFDRLFSSFWGGCPSERHEDRQHYIRDNLEKLPTLDQLRQPIAAFIDVFHRTPHSAIDLFGKSPLEAMEAFRDEPARMESAKVLDLLFREFVGPKQVRRDGVKYLNRWYGQGDPRLVAMQGQKVLLAIQPDDASRAIVCDLNRTPLFEIKCVSLRGFTQRDAADLARRSAQLLRPYSRQAATARKLFRKTSPADLLANRAAGIEAMHGQRIPATVAPPTLTVRPALEEAIDDAAPTPDEAAWEAVRTGTDDRLSVEDILADDLDEGTAQPAAAQDQPIDFFGLNEPGGGP